MESTSQLGQQE